MPARGNKVVQIGTAAANSGIVITVNTNAAWLLGTIPPSTPTNFLPSGVLGCVSTNNFNLNLGFGTASTNNQLVVNGGVVSNVFIANIGNAANCVGNQLLITNGGQFYCGFNLNNLGGQVGFVLGGNAGASSNSVVVIGTNSSGAKSILDIGATRFQMGNNQSASYNSIRVDQGGIITNGTLYMISSVNSSFIVTNGGVFYAVGQQSMIGRANSTNNLVIVAGLDSAGNPSLYNNFNQSVTISGFNSTNSSNGTNNGVWISTGGLLTNVTTVNIGGAGAGETNESGNYLIVTNGGRCYSTASVIGSGTNDINNWAYVGGAFGTTNALWNLTGGTLTVGAAAAYNTNNSLTVGAGGVVTNIGTLTVGANALATNSWVLVNGGNLYATNVNVTTNSYLNMLNNGTVIAANITAKGGTIGGSGTFNSLVSITPQGMLAPGGVGTIGTLTISSNLTLNGSGSLLFDLTSPVTAGTTYDQVVINGSLVFVGNSFLQLSATTGWVTNGSYTLMTYPQGRQGQGTVVFPVTGTTNWGNLWLTNGPTSLVLGVTTTTQLSAIANNLTWKGTGGNNGTWDSATDTATLNWSSNGVSQTYADGDFVRFDDTASFFTVTNNTGSVGYSPGDVIFANGAQNYVIGAAINGAGTVTLAGNKAVTFTGTNTYTGNTLISAGGTLIVTNGGSINSPNGTLNVQNGTNTLAGGSITVKTLLAANNSVTATNAFVNLNGGTLTTSNLNGFASYIVLATNTSFNLNSSWTMNAGTNTIISAWEAAGLSGSNSGKAVIIGSAAANSGLVVTVNSNAVWSLGNLPNTLGASNNLSLALGAGTGSTNNILLINGGIVTNVGGPSANPSAMSIGTGTSASGNWLIITNGGQLYSGNGDNGTPYSQIGSGAGANSNGVVIINPNLAGPKSIWNGGNVRLNFGGNQNSHYNSLRVDQGGWLTNINMVQISSEDSTFIVTNGGVAAMPGFDWGRGNATNNQVIVAGADANGNLATLNCMAGTLAVGGTTAGSSPNGLNNTMWIMQNGQVFGATTVYVGGGTVATETNIVNSALVITNGGQFNSTGSATIGANTNCYDNYVYVGGAFGSTNSLWNAGAQTLRIGGGSGTGSTFATSNTLTVAANGVVTNLSTLTVGYDLTATNNGVIVGGGYLYAATVIVNTNNYLTLTNNGTLVGAVTAAA